MHFALSSHYAPSLLGTSLILLVQIHSRDLMGALPHLSCPPWLPGAYRRKPDSSPGHLNHCSLVTTDPSYPLCLEALLPPLYLENSYASLKTQGHFGTHCVRKSWVGVRWGEVLNRISQSPSPTPSLTFLPPPFCTGISPPRIQQFLQGVSQTCPAVSRSPERGRGRLRLHTPHPLPPHTVVLMGKVGRPREAETMRD